MPWARRMPHMLGVLRKRRSACYCVHGVDDDQHMCKSLSDHLPLISVLVGNLLKCTERCSGSIIIRGENIWHSLKIKPMMRSML